MSRRPCPCVGAIVKDSRGRILVLYRIKDPKGLALPAGHIDRGETPEDAVVRELEEETGLKYKIGAPVLNGVLIKGPCTRGAKRHRWFVYRVWESTGKPKRREKKKHAFVKFMSIKKIREDYLKNNDVEPAWVEIFKRLRMRGLS